MSLRTTQLLVKETLYDSLKRVAITTVPVCKQNDNGATNASSLGFISDLISSRDPAQSSSTWVSGGALTGTITSWVDTESFCLTNDTDYAYTGRYFETDPASRTVQSNLPGVTFLKSSDFTQPDFSVSYYQNYLPGNLSQNSPLPSMLTTEQMITQYQLGAQQTSLGSTLGLITKAGWQDFLGRSQAKAIVDANNNYLLTSQSYQIGAQLSTGLTNNVNSQVPIMNLQQTFLPNYFSSLTTASNFSLQNQINALGQLVQTISPDTGSTVLFYDNYGRLRFSQTADQQAAGVIQYVLYDALNRVTEVGLFPGTWDISTFQQQTTSPTTTQPSGAVPQKQMVYDQLDSASNAFTANSQGRVVQVTTNTITANDATINVATENVTELYTYDSWGRPIAITTQLANTTTNAETSYTVQYTYSGLSLITSLNYPDGFTVFYAHNLQGLVDGIYYITSGTPTIPYGLATYTYNVYGQVVTETLADTSISSPDTITCTMTYGNSLSQLTGITVENSTTQTPLFTESLCYTNDSGGDNTQGTYQDGNIQQITYNYAAFQGVDFSPYTMTYGYDTFGRLKGAGITPASYGKWIGLGTISYDANGNYLGLTSQTSGQYTYNNNNQVQTIALCYSAGTVAYQYTASGLTSQILVTDNTNTVQTTTNIVYDVVTAMPIVTTVAMPQQTITNLAQVLLYDSRGERVQKVVLNTTDSENINPIYTLTYIRGLGARCLMEYDGNNNPLLHYVYGPLGLVAMQDPNNQTTYYNFRDHAGSCFMIYEAQNNSATGYRGYDCFGRVTFADDAFRTAQTNLGQNYLFRYGYTGQEWDFETQLYNYHARLYDPVYLRRFLTPDPAHQFASPYVYVGNNPINATDSTGKTINIGQTNIHSDGVDLITELPSTALLNSPSSSINMNKYYAIMTAPLTPEIYGIREIIGKQFNPILSVDRLNVSVSQAGLAGAPRVLQTEFPFSDGSGYFTRPTRGLNIVEESGMADLGVRYLPDEVNHITYMTLDPGAKYFYSGPFNGCDFAVAHSDALGTTVFHSHFHSGGAGPITDSVTLQRLAVSQAAERLGYNKWDISHYLPSSRYTHMDISGTNDATGFIYGEKNSAGTWGFYVQAVKVTQSAGAQITSDHVPIRAIGYEI